MMMAHLTLNSGKCNQNAERPLLPQLEKVVHSMLDKGGGSFPSPYQDYRIETEIATTGVTFQFFKGETPISLCVGTWSAEVAQEYWTDIGTQFSGMSKAYPQMIWAKPAPEIPDSVPWLATLLLPEFFLLVKSDSQDVEFLNTCEFVFFAVAHELAHS